MKLTMFKFDMSNDEVELIMVENGLDGDSEVNVLEAKKAICKSLGVWLPIYSNVSEGGVSKAWNFEAVKLYYSALCSELGIRDITQPVVRDRSNIW